MSPWRLFLELPLRDRVVIVAGGMVAAVGAWLVVIAGILLGGSPA